MLKRLFGVSLFALAFIALPTFAVGSYKGMTFGDTKESILLKGVCSLAKATSPTKEVEHYACSNFPFGGSITEASAFFIDDKFYRFAVVTPISMAQGLKRSLIKKYGAPSDQSPQQTFEVVDRQPNTRAFLSWEGGTVILQIISDERMNQIILLVYSATYFDDLVAMKQQESLDSDI